jgi:DNA replication regulator DPB11
MEVQVTSTSLTEKEGAKLRELLAKRFTKTTYSPDLTNTVKVLVVNLQDEAKHWLKSKKFMFVVAYRPEILVIDYHDVCKTAENAIDRKPIISLPRVRAFEKLTISLCRLEDDLSEKIHKLITSQGGTVITHLTNETDIMVSMMAEGKRFEAANQWELPVVSPDWCFDSHERGLPLNPVFYKLQKNVTDVARFFNFEDDSTRVGSETTVKTYKLGKRNLACDWDKLKEWKNGEASRRLEEYIVNKNFNKDLISQKDGEGDLQVDGIENTNRNSSIGNTDDSITILNSSDSDTNKMKHSIDDDAEDEVVVLKKKAKHGGLWNPLNKKNRNAGVKLEMNKALIKKEEQKGPIFRGMVFKTIGFQIEEERKLRKVIARFGGRVISYDANDEPTFTVVSFKSELKVEGRNIITELAIERFIFNEKVDSGDDLWCRPFYLPGDLSMNDVRSALLPFSDTTTNAGQKLLVSITGFEGTDLSHIERLLTLKLNKWVQFEPVFSQKCDILIDGHASTTANSTGRGRKQQMAQRWGTPLVRVEAFCEHVRELGESGVV